MNKRRITQLLTLAFAALAFAFVTSCEGPAGPAGTNGTNGTNGTDGAAGAAGIDGNVTCLECHGVENMETITFQFSSSQHKAGDIAVDYAGGRGSCAECHSHEGFIEWAATGDVAADISNPQAWECSTCHNLHTTFEATDYAFRAGDDVTLVSGNVIAGGNNNTCLNCHKSRRDIGAYDNVAKDTIYTRKFTGDDIAQYTIAAVGPTGTQGVLNATSDTLTVKFGVPTGTYAYISSTHAGPHHGPQGDVWAGENGSGVVTTGAPFAAHAGGCVECHMGPDSGHSYKPEEGNCMVTGCHSSSKESSLDAIAARITAAGVALEAIHAVHYSDGAYHPVYASLTKSQFNAWWDFMVVLDDRSNGAHNPDYVKALLTSIETELGI